MKKAVGYLIPFMEEEKQARYKELTEQGIEFDEDVSLIWLKLLFVVECLTFTTK